MTDRGELRPGQSAVSLFANTFDVSNGTITTLHDIITRMADPDPSDYMVQAYEDIQSLIQEGASDKEIANAKTRLPAVEFSLARTSRERGAPQGYYTGLVCIDYDTKNPNVQNAEALKNALHDLDWVVHVQDSAADGVWALIQLYPIPNNAEEFKQAAYTVCGELQRHVDHTQYNFEIDDHTFSEAGLRFISPDVTPYGSHDNAMMFYWQDNQNAKQTKQDNIYDVILSALQANIEDKTPYNGWLFIGMALHSCIKDLGLDPHILLKMWDNWSASDKKYAIGVCEQKWATFNDGNREGKKKDINWLIGRAREQGWQGGDLQTTVEQIIGADTKATETHVIEGEVLNAPFTNDDISDWAARVSFSRGNLHYNPVTGFWYKSLITGQGGGVWVPREFKTIKDDAFQLKNSLRKWAYSLGTDNFPKKLQKAVDGWSVRLQDESIWANACIPDILPNELSAQDDSLRLFTRRGVMEIGKDNKTLHTVEWSPFLHFNKTILNTWLSNEEINRGSLTSETESMFREFMTMGCDGDEELYDYLSLVLGAALSGDIGKSTQLVLFVIGNTGTGKSSLLTGLKTVFGGLCMSVVPKDIQVKAEAHNDAMANLIENKVRYAIMDEIAGKFLPVDALKKLSGGGYYTTRRAYGKGNVEGHVRCLAIASGESFPVVSSDPAFERRLRPIEWYGGKTRPSAGKKDLPYHELFSDPESDMCRSLLMYIMNGLKRYLEYGPNALNKLPQAMKNTTDSFSRESDPLRYTLIDWINDEEKQNNIHNRSATDIAKILKEKFPDAYGEQSDRSLSTSVGAKLRSIDGVNQLPRTSRGSGCWIIDSRNLEQNQFAQFEEPETESDEFSSFKVH